MMVKPFLISFVCLFILFPILNCSEKRNADQDFEKAIYKFKKEKLNHISQSQKTLPFITKVTMDPVWEETNPAIIIVPSFSFRNQNDSIITEKILNDRVTVVCFFYTRCGGFCPSIMRNMNRIRNALGDSLYMLSFSVTPDIDTPEVLTAYAKKTGYAKRNWELLTGEKEKIYELARNTFNADTNTFEKKSVNDFIHSEQIYIIDSKRRLRGVYNGNVNGDIERVIDSIKKIEKLN